MQHYITVSLQDEINHIFPIDKLGNILYTRYVVTIHSNH